MRESFVEAFESSRLSQSRLAPGNHLLWLVMLASVVAAVNDGWSGRPAPLLHQIGLIPFDVVFTVGLLKLLNPQNTRSPSRVGERSLRTVWAAIGVFEMLSVLSLFYAAHHFATFGYRLHPRAFISLLGIVAASWVTCLRSGSNRWLLTGVTLTYSAGAVLSILSFPLNYLRSDMLPVIVWADRRLAAHLNPYVTMHVDSRLYDFPYLPGMLVAYLPVVAAHLDPRWFNLACLLLTVGLLYRCAAVNQQRAAILVIAIFLLSPFLQYRHDLYLEPHWLALAGAIVLVQQRRYQWGAAVFGVSMALYQLSWVLWPFLLLFALRRRGWPEVARAAGCSLAAMGLVVGPFARSAMSRIANNTVGQWSRMPHALADPINLSYWVTFLVCPDQLKWVQLAVLSGVFGYCVLHDRCRSLEDTLRWMSAALAIFISLNVLVDGYFYLTLMLVLVMYTLCATRIWERSEPAVPLSA